MLKKFCYFVIIFIAILIIDQAIKYIIILIAKPKSLDDFIYIANGSVISLALVFNVGVAFSFFTWLGEWLKFIQLGLIAVIIIILCTQKQLFKQHYIAFALMLSGGTSNILDRFLHGGVVDYIFWHYRFNFPIFNFADVIIDCGIGLFILQTLLLHRKNKA